jgi:hypothetical protein
MSKVTPAILKATIQESVRTALVENKNVQRTILESRVALINEMIEINEVEWVDRARKWLKNKAWGAEQGAKDFYRNKVQINPKAIIDDPGNVASLMDTTIAKAKKDVTAFKADALRSSEAINKLQNSVFDLFGKFNNLQDKLPQDENGNKIRGKYEREVMQVVGMFYVALMEEKKRIEVYLSALAQEAGAKGYNLGQSATAFAGYRPERTPKVVGSRVVEPEDEPVARPAVASGFRGARA